MPNLLETPNIMCYSLLIDDSLDSTSPPLYINIIILKSSQNDDFIGGRSGIRNLSVILALSLLKFQPVGWYQPCFPGRLLLLLRTHIDIYHTITFFFLDKITFLILIRTIPRHKSGWPRTKQGPFYRGSGRRRINMPLKAPQIELTLKTSVFGFSIKIPGHNFRFKQHGIVREPSNMAGLLPTI